MQSRAGVVLIGALRAVLGPKNRSGQPLGRSFVHVVVAHGGGGPGAERPGDLRHIESIEYRFARRRIDRVESIERIDPLSGPRKRPGSCFPIVFSEDMIFSILLVFAVDDDSNTCSENVYKKQCPWL